MTEISDATLAEFSARIYDHPQTVNWTAFQDEWPPDGVCGGLLQIGDTDVLVFRGSATFLDWRRNLDEWARAQPLLGGISFHPGFFKGLEPSWRRAQTFLRGGPVYLTGHSLGAAHANGTAALMIRDGLKPAALVGFGEPKCGFQDLADYLSVIPRKASYRNGDDLHRDMVPDVAYPLPGQPYVQRIERIKITRVPDPGDSLGAFAWHRSQYYAEALAREAG